MKELYLKPKNMKSVGFVFSLIISVLMGIFIFITSEKIDIPSVLTTSFFFSIMLFIAIIPFVIMDNMDILKYLIIAASLAFLIYIRVCMLFYKSRDYNLYLYGWVLQFSNLSVKDALKNPIGDYNLPYVYFLIFVSRFLKDSLVFIKTLSCFFDVALAFFSMKLVGLFVKNDKIVFLSFLLVFALPTVVLNGAYWGQCDSIYTCFCIASIYYALKRNGRVCVILWTIGFVFKLQSVFVIPCLILIFIFKKIKIKYLLWSPIVYFISLIPALICGRSLKSCISIYISQTKDYPSLVLNAPTVWNIFSKADVSNFTVIGIFITGFICLLFLYFCYLNIEKLNNKNIINICFILSLVIPYFLPRMHDRYFCFNFLFCI